MTSGCTTGDPVLLYEWLGLCNGTISIVIQKSVMFRICHGNFCTDVLTSESHNFRFVYGIEAYE
jgi:hypothetical protein